MKAGLKIGTTGTREFRVEPAHVIDFAGDGMPAILCTPWLIWFLEHAAREAVLPFLEPRESTVGLHVDVDHLAATPLSRKVMCTGRVINIEGRTISFQLEARDETELIARGFHRMRVIQVEKFAARVNRK